ncbi:15-hydroxyprostaglandin dehydrogenase [NAD(+)]-like isoform X3 [Gymnodraco acuticeps]|uniref:15-hydroxyprostaglandin dehydrogenase [NAD(+)]-like isoform X3 n=1 Tax=Gymnodraco acuticeps TaxID=8218 RepID=A0A6P8TF08_GYMAC|nr:15-hydroxyprostaglandin dehydrogenase [NAD(+)]-like isoform X3 [Gymnodraco acuticeps]
MALNGKIAVVTGAAQGIGKAITELLLQNGAEVALLDTNKTKGESLKEALDQLYGEQSTLFLHCNVESEEEIKAAFQKTLAKFGRIDILCNNAGILNEVEWEKTISINLVAVVRCTYLALEHMNKMTGGQGGVIVNMASMAVPVWFSRGPACVSVLVSGAPRSVLVQFSSKISLFVYFPPL